jgi:hypothetical protein
MRHFVASILLLALAGCSTTSLFPIAPSGEARLFEARAALERVRVSYNRAAPPEIRVRVMRRPGDGVGGYANGVIYMDSSLLEPAIDYRPVVAHETAHWLRGDAGDAKCPGHMTDCEHAANVLGVQVLERGWGLSRDEAATLMCAQLTQDVADTKSRRSRTPRGHDFPGELERFRREMKLWNNCQRYAGETR